MVAPEQVSPNEEMASSMAFFCAEDPSAFRLPVPHEPEAEPEAEALDELESELEPPAEVLLSDPQAVSARAPTRATPLRRASRLMLTVDVSWCRTSWTQRSRRRQGR